MDQILEIALREFLNRGFKTITMDHVAQSAGISKKTLYEKFTNKDELVEKAIESFISVLESFCITYKQNSTNALEEVMESFNMMENHFKIINPNSVLELKKFYPKSYKIFEDYKKNAIYKLIFDNILRGQNEGLYRENLNVEILATFRVESMMLILNERHNSFMNYTFYELNTEIALNFLFGMTTSSGHKFLEKYLKKKLK